MKNGVSALGLQRVLGLGSYETAWTWLHKLRRAMMRHDRDRISGEVEIYETDVGSPEEGMRGRQVKNKAFVVVATEKRSKGIWRIRLRYIKNASAESLMQFVRDVIALGSAIHSDGWRGYNGLEETGYPHWVTVISTSPEQAHELMPRVHIVTALLKR